MPYISEAARARLSRRSGPQGVGDLTYLLYRECVDYLDSGPGNYQQHAEVIGALVCTVLEVYRRRVAPYEDRKIAENGDV